MKKTFNILIIVSIIVMLFSCKNQDEFLDKKPLGDYSEDVVWTDPALVETFVNTMYRNALGFPFAIVRLSDVSDESHFTPDWGITDFNKSLMTSDGLMGWSTDWGNLDPTAHTLHYRWAPLYSNVRRCNIFFSKIKTVTGEKTTIDNLKGQAYLLRAWTYFYLTNLYGGVPIITKVYGLTDEFNVPRDSYENCIKFIVGQIDSAAMNLPDAYATNGRITKGAALAFKARVLLYAASDLHNSSKNSVATTGASKPELLGYVGGDVTARWTAAKNAAKAVIDLGKYKLYKPTPAATDSVALNFVELFTSKGTDEDILLQFFTPKTDESWSGYNPALYSGPNGYHNWGNNTPLGDLVDDYEMKDGSKFDWNNPKHKANPYLKRDARFYATVTYEGVQWRKRPDDALKIDPFSKIQVGYVYDLSGKMIKAGLDTRSGPIEDWNGGKSGYYLRKWIDTSLDPQYVKQDVPFKHLRYGEVLLNYAEACIELGQDAEARTYINMIRTRAGQPALAATVTGNALRLAYRQERRIEMAFEDQRFWDVRRWLIAPEAYHQTSRVDVRYVTSEAVTSYRKPDGSTWGAPIFSKADLGGDARAWNNKCYFFPIMRDEMNKNNKLVQNPGY
ncbi:MAG: RagB/SusD family nutrient uptake outer membrane protein [Bacteroidota bacterium]|nr:RagB/SusD family nutrient uptake outer membrane protein [Odoribacter sp.]MDP3642244.1 RagB/SusD family nutrient uptake outer membrane protein [Bacteroidota bacterium]